MANAFSKEEVVLFEDIVAGFGPNNITAGQVSKFKPPSTVFERSALTVHRTMPYITKGTEGLVLASGAFADRTQLTVPSTLNANDSAPSHIRNIPFKMNAVELNDPLQRERIKTSAIQQLSATADSVVANEVAKRGSLFIKNGGAITTYAHVARAEELMSIRDVPIMSARTLIMNPTDYNSVAGNLADRDAPLAGTSLTAYERSKIPTVATFDSFKANFMPTQAAQTGTGWLVNGANQDHDPAATDANGNNVDNRTQNLTIDTGSGTIAEGDAFTIAGVFAVGMIHKNVTAELQTFRVVSRTSATVIVITPAIVAATGGGGAQANIDYANVDAAPADNAAITFLNITAAQPSNIFFVNEAVEIVHGSLATMELDGSAGVASMRTTTDSGIELLFAKSSEVLGLSTSYRMTMWMTANVLCPEMCGNLVK